MDRPVKLLTESTANARWNYDEEADVLYISAGEPKPADSVDVEGGTLVLYDRDRKQIVGATIVGLRARLQRVLEERE